MNQNWDTDATVVRARLLIKQLWSLLLTGILIAVPLIVTFWVLSLAYSFISEISAPLWKALGVTSGDPQFAIVPAADGRLVVRMHQAGGIPMLNFCTTLVLLICLGLMATRAVGRRIIDRTETALMRLPLIAPLYGAVKQVLDSFRMMSSGGKAKRVVYLEYPSKGSLLIGFVTGQYFEPRLQHHYTLVFLPMAPNPLAGFVVAVPDESIIECSLTFEEASKLIVSGGLVVPPTVTSVEPPTSR